VLRCFLLHTTHPLVPSTVAKVCDMAFWSASITAESPKAENVPVNALLIVTNLALAEQSSGTTTLRVDVDGGESLAIAHLDSQHPQYATTVHFLPGSVVNFKVDGKGKVNVIGFYEAANDYESDEDVSEEEVSSSVEALPYGNQNRVTIRELKPGEESSDAAGAGKSDEESQSQSQSTENAAGAQQQQPKEIKKLPKEQKKQQKTDKKPKEQQQQQQQQGGKKRTAEGSGDQPKKKQKTETPKKAEGKGDKSAAASPSGGELKCSQCPKTFSNEHALKQHLTAKHSPKK
jgi:hypothetical protein